MSLNSTAETNAVPPVAQPQRAIRPQVFYLIVAIVFIADQITKNLITQRLSLGASSPLLGDSFQLTLAHNTGGAWGLLPKGNLFFILFAIGATTALVLAYHRMAQVEFYVGSAFALALGGALGNLIDRVRFGYVVDFFDARIIHFPVFNVADSAITVGIFLLMIQFVRSSSPKQEA